MCDSLRKGSSRPTFSPPRLKRELHFVQLPDESNPPNLHNVAREDPAVL